MPKINSCDAFVIFTPPIRKYQLDPTVGQIAIESEDRVKLYTERPIHRRLAKSRKLLPDEAENAELKSYLAIVRLVILDSLSFKAVWNAFAAVEGMHEAIPDGRYRDPKIVEVG